MPSSPHTLARHLAPMAEGPEPIRSRIPVQPIRHPALNPDLSAREWGRMLERITGLWSPMSRQHALVIGEALLMAYQSPEFVERYGVLGFEALEQMLNDLLGRPMEGGTR